MILAAGTVVLSWIGCAFIIRRATASLHNRVMALLVKEREDFYAELGKLVASLYRAGEYGLARTFLDNVNRERDRLK